MKKILPILLIIGFLFFSFAFVPKVSAQLSASSSGSLEGKWVSDPDVTFVGKTGARSGQFLDWTLQNYEWMTLVDGKNPLVPFWGRIRDIVYAVIALFVLVTAFILIITRGQSITLMRFMPRFVFIIVLITLSFSLVQFIYVVNDIIQGFFLRVDGRVIQTLDLLYIGFDYETFTGFKRVGLEFEESAFISLLLVRLTAITYYVMTGLLLVRKIILWFFIIISPVFPLLLFYRPIRNTAKIWVGEFFRWLLYAPLFAIFLHGLVEMWRIGIPLPFPQIDQGLPGKAESIVYPTAINILLGGPGQALSITNTVNLGDTFALYVVALLMLWVVILLPFLLLKIFLDYLSTFSFENNLLVKQFMNRNFSFLSPKGMPPPPPPPPPGLVHPTGMARALPFLKGHQMKVEPVQFHATVQASVAESASVLALANLSIPRMRDIARFETSSVSRDSARKNEVSSFHSALQKIANPASVSTISEREKFRTVREKLLSQKEKGNPIASSVLNASQATSKVSNIASSVLNVSQISNVQTKQEQMTKMSNALSMIANPQKATQTSEREKFVKIKEQLLKEKEKGNSLASSILETSEKIEKIELSGNQRANKEAELLDQLLASEKKEKEAAIGRTGIAGAPGVKPHEGLPIVNKVQQVSLEDYEEVRKLWSENYQTFEPPHDLSGKEINRREWISADIERVNQAITLLSSPDPARVSEGMEMVGNILPFLLIGGFSKSEVVAYLKAKSEAGKQVLSDIQKKEEEEDMLVARESKKKEEAGTLRATVEETPSTSAASDTLQPGEKPKEELNNDKAS